MVRSGGWATSFPWMVQPARRARQYRHGIAIAGNQGDVDFQRGPRQDNNLRATEESTPPYRGLASPRAGPAPRSGADAQVRETPQ